jgi:putative transcriptional regulator
VRVREKHVIDALAKADWKKIDGMRDRDIARAIRTDPDGAELDLRRPIEVVLPETIDVADIRHRLHLSQAGFARRIGVSARLVSDWEQGRQRPAAAARALLLILDELGEVALKALARGAA